MNIRFVTALQSAQKARALAASQLHRANGSNDV